MRRALIAVAVTALMGGLVVAPVTEQTARAGFSGLKAAGTAPSGNLVTLVGRRRPHGGGGHGGGGHVGGGHYGGGHMRGGHYGGGHVCRGHRGGSYAYRGGGGSHYRGRHYAAPKHYGHYNNHYNYKYRRYAAATTAITAGMELACTATAMAAAPGFAGRL